MPPDTRPRPTWPAMPRRSDRNAANGETDGYRGANSSSGQWLPSQGASRPICAMNRLTPVGNWRISANPERWSAGLRGICDADAVLMGCVAVRQVCSEKGFRAKAQRREEGFRHGETQGRRDVVLAAKPLFPSDLARDAREEAKGRPAARRDTSASLRLCVPIPFFFAPLRLCAKLMAAAGAQAGTISRNRGNKHGREALTARGGSSKQGDR
jgi:hypothetical protein